MAILKFRYKKKKMDRYRQKMEMTTPNFRQPSTRVKEIHTESKVVILYLYKQSNTKTVDSRYKKDMNQHVRLEIMEIFCCSEKEMFIFVFSS